MNESPEEDDFISREMVDAGVFALQWADSYSEEGLVTLIYQAMKAASQTHPAGGLGTPAHTST
jgi:hypothetical protein